jgi:AraC-like DNA-binding protein
MDDYERGGWDPSPGAGSAALALDRRVSAAADLRGSLCIWPEGILFVGEHVRSEPHRHFTASLFFALSGSLRVRVEGKPGWFETRAALVAPNVMQEMDAGECRLVNLQIDPESDAYARVAPRLLVGAVHALPDAVGDELSTRACAMLGDPAWSPTRLWEVALALVGGPPSARRRFDPRIGRVLDRLKREVLSPPTAAHLARTVGLSEGRLLHLFSEELGVPLRRYILWLRLRKVIYTWALTRSLTEAAHAAGFADSAHLSRTFRSMYGIRPSDVLRSDGRVALLVGLPSGGVRGPHASHDGPLWAHAAAALDGASDVHAADEDHRWLPLG